MDLKVKASRISHSNSPAKLSPTPSPVDVRPTHQLHLLTPAHSILNMSMKTWIDQFVIGALKM